MRREILLLYYKHHKVAHINTKQQITHPGEDACLLAAICDNGRSHHRYASQILEYLNTQAEQTIKHPSKKKLLNINTEKTINYQNGKDYGTNLAVNRNPQESIESTR